MTTEAQVATIVTHRYIACPYCGQGESRIDHLKPGTKAGPWFCDECGRAYRPSVALDGTVMVAETDERKFDTWDLLVLKPQEKPVYFIVPGSRYTGRAWADPDRTEDDSKRYSYETYSCPTNWLHPEIMAFDGDPDPHGLIEYVRHVDASSLPPEEHPGNRQSYEWFSTFPELQRQQV